MKWIPIIFVYTDGYNRIIVNIYKKYNILFYIIKYPIYSKIYKFNSNLTIEIVKIHLNYIQRIFLVLLYF